MVSLCQNKLQELYEVDDYLWLQGTIHLLKTDQIKSLDIDNLIEELTELGRSHFNRVRSLLKQIIIHLLWLEYWQQEYDYNHRHWRAEIINFRDDLQQNLTTSLKNKLGTELESVYQVATRFVVQKTGLSANAFPQFCPYTWVQLTDENWYP